MTGKVLPQATSYEDLCARFQWSIPARFNIGVDICDRHADDPARVAMIYENEAGVVSEHTFAQFRARSNQLANGLKRLGVAPGDRVGIVMSQRPETANAHIAIYKLGAIALPLATLFGPEALEYRLRNAGVRVVITDALSIDRLLEVQKKLPELAHIISADAASAANVHDYSTLLAAESTECEVVATAATDPALLIYTSGTTGPPKGALHAHRILLGRLPSMEFVHQSFPQPGDRFWTPADWAWAGGLLDVLWPALYHGIAVVGSARPKFDAEWAFRFMAEHAIRNVFMPPTALRLLRQLPASSTRPKPKGKRSDNSLPLCSQNWRNIR